MLPMFVAYVSVLDIVKEIRNIKFKNCVYKIVYGIPVGMVRVHGDF